MFTLTGFSKSCPLICATKVNDATSSVSIPRLLDKSGTASLLVADDDLEGALAVVVILDATGHVISKEPTIIGGDY